MDQISGKLPFVRAANPQLGQCMWNITALERSHQMLGRFAVLFLLLSTAMVASSGHSGIDLSEARATIGKGRRRPGVLPEDDNISLRGAQNDNPATAVMIPPTAAASPLCDPSSPGHDCFRTAPCVAEGLPFPPADTIHA